MRRQITGSVRAGETVTRIAERLLDIGQPIVRLPQHVAELRDAARMAIERGDQNLYLKAVEKWRGTVERLGQGKALAAGEHTVRSATQALVKDLGRAKLEQVDEFVDRWVVERARYQARVIARTEAVEAFRQQYQESMAAQPHVVGFRWTLSSSHPKPDVCEILAQQDLDGLGPGGYRAGNVPSNPHPHCLCSIVAIVDSLYFKRELAKLKGGDEPPKPWESGKRETGQDWVARQPDAYQRRLLGPTRFAALKAGQHVIDQKGRPKPVYEITGSRKRPLRFGQAVPAAPAIKRDRRGQVRPFPSVPPVPASGPIRSAGPAGKPPEREQHPTSALQRRQARRELMRQRVEAKAQPALAAAETAKLQTTEHWLSTEFEAKYGRDAGQALAHGKAAEYRGRAMDARSAQRRLRLLKNGGVELPRWNGESPLVAAQKLAKRKFKTHGEAIEHLEQTGEEPDLVGQLRVSAAFAGHRQSIAARTAPIGLQRPRIDKGAKCSEREVWKAMTRARAVFARVCDRSLLQPEKTVFFANGDERGFQAGLRINVGNGSVSTVAHEWGHALDYANLKLNRRALEYYKRRTKDETPVSLRDATNDIRYKLDEKTRPDELFNAYMGKVCSGTTEVTSVLTQQLVTPGGLTKLYARDRDSFYFLLGQLSGQ
jgi:hypothetical protein